MQYLQKLIDLHGKMPAREWQIIPEETIEQEGDFDLDLSELPIDEHAPQEILSSNQIIESQEPYAGLKFMVRNPERDQDKQNNSP